MESAFAARNAARANAPIVSTEDGDENDRVDLVASFRARGRMRRRCDVPGQMTRDDVVPSVPGRHSVDARERERAHRTMPSRAFIDIDIDDRREKHARARAFVEATNLRYGFSSKSLDELGGSERARVPELYASDYEWNDRGPIELSPAARERVIFELYDEDAPLACENFKALCRGDGGASKDSGCAYSYKNVRFHRCVKDFMMQGGDFTMQNGAGGESVYGKKFKDDPRGLKRRHARAGTLAMGNTGKNSNTSQFYITFKGPLKQLDGKHVVFGEVVEGMEVIERINEECAVPAGGTTEEPLTRVVVADCGVL